jgi:hypothetical protein
MRNKVVAVAAMAILCGAGFSWAEDAAKEVTLKGTFECAKCELHETDKCQNVLKVTENGKDTLYYLNQNKVSKAAHSMICGKPKEGVSVTGVVSEKDGKKVIEASKVD